MAVIVATRANYWIGSTALSITLNALGEPNRIQASVASGAVIMCYIRGVDGLDFDNGHDYRRWPLTISPTYFNSNTEKYLYVAIPRSNVIGSKAMVVFPSQKLDIYGYEVVEDSETHEQTQGEQIGTDDYYYIWLQGIITSSGEGGYTPRAWRDDAQPDYGILRTDEATDSTETDWYRWNPITQTVTFLKDIWMDATSAFKNLRLTKMIFNGHELNGVAIKNVTPGDSDDTIVTPAYLDGFTDGKYLRKDRDDRTEFSLGIGGELTVGGATYANGGVKTDEVRSTNYSGDTIADTGFLLSNNILGRSKLIIDEIYVRVKAVFEALEVKKWSVVAGDEIRSCAANTIALVDYLGPDGQRKGYSYMKIPWLLKGMPFLRKVASWLNYPNFYSKKKWIRMTLTEDELRDVVYCRCYFLAKDGEKEIENWWKGSTDGGYEYGHDLARCQTMNLKNSERKTYLPSIAQQSKVGNVFWWRKVMNVSNNPVTIDDKEYHYFDVYLDYFEEKRAWELGEQVSWCSANSDIPVAGDDVVQFGNDSNPGRMNLIMNQVNGGGKYDYDTSDAPCTKYYRGIYTFNLNKCWWGGKPCKCKLSPATGYEFYGPDFKFIKEYGEKKVEMQRGKWTDISTKKDDYIREEYPDYSDDKKDATTGEFESRADGHAKNYVRKCYYYDSVTHQGCTWLCTIQDESHWVAPDDWGVPCFDNDGNYLDNGHAISDADYATLSDSQKAQCGRLTNYTNTEPATGNPNWIKLVDRGTSVKTVEVSYAKDSQGSIPPTGAWDKHTIPAPSGVWLTAAEVNNNGGLVHALGLIDGDYLWTRTKTSYSDTLADTYSYSVSRWGIDGDGIYSINSYFLGRQSADSINVNNDNFPMPGDAGYDQAAEPKWHDTFDGMVTANGGAGAIQGWYAWTKTIITYDQPEGQSTHKPDVISYQFNRIGVDGQIGEEEYYMLAASDDFNMVFGSATPAKNAIGIVWYNQNNPASEKYRLASNTPQQSNINTTNAVGFLSTTPFWTPIRPTYDKNTHGDKIYLWNFEYRADGQGTPYATRPICIGNHARGIIGVQELYACSQYGVPQTGRLYPNDISNSGTSTENNWWTDEIYDRAPTEERPYQWNKTVTIYIDSYGTKNGQTKKASDWTDRQGVVWDESSCDVYYHVSAVRGTNGEDGAGEESIYITSTTEITTWGNAQSEHPHPKYILKDKNGVTRDAAYIAATDDFVPYGWSDNPIGIDETNKYEYVSTRRLGAADAQGRKLWGEFSDPVIRSNWGKNGVDGDGTEYVFMRTKNNVAPTFAVNDGGNATDYKSQKWKPYISNYDPTETSSSKAWAESNRCTDNPKGTDITYKFEWVAKRTMDDAAASGANQGRREWLSYYTCTQQGESASETHKMSLWSNLAESIEKDGPDTYRYKVSDSGTTTPTGTWYNTRAAAEEAYAWTVNRWMWTETTIHWSNNTTTVLYTNERNPNDGVAGQDIVVDGSTVVTYCMTDNNTQQPADNLFKSYAEAMADLSDTKRWLWSKATTNYKKSVDGSSAGSSSNYNVSYIPKNGTNGTSPYFADIDNEMDSVACNAQGNTLADYDQHIGVHVWHGSTEQDITTLTTDSITGITITPDKTNKRIRVQVDAGTNIAAVNTITITIASSSSGNMTLRFTLNGVRPGADGKNAVLYNLLPSVDEVSVGRTDSGGYNPQYNTLRCGYRKNDGGTNTTVTEATGNIDSKYRIFFRRRTRGGSYEDTYYYYNNATHKRKLVVTSGYSTSGLDAATYDQVEFIIYPDTSNSSLSSITESSVIDRETVPVIADGTDGSNGTDGRAITMTSEHYKVSDKDGSAEHQEAKPIADGQENASLEWTTNPNTAIANWGANARYLWNYEKITYSKGTTPMRTTPRIIAIWTEDGSDGKGIDSIINKYCVTNSSTAPSKTDTTVGWDDNPMAPTAQEPYLWNYEYIVWTDGTSTYNDAIVHLMGHYGKDGSNGTSPWVADLDNEMDSVSCDDTGNPVEQQTVTTKLYLYHGSSNSNFKVTQVHRTFGNSSERDYTSNTTYDNVAVNLSSGFNNSANSNILTITYNTGAKITGKDDFRIRITDANNGNSKELHFIVNGVNGDVYNLKPSVDVIHATRPGNTYVVGNSSTYDLCCGYTKNVKGVVTEIDDITEVSTWDNELHVDSRYNIFFRRHLRTGDWEKSSNKYYWWNYGYSGHKSKVASFDVNTYDAIEFVLAADTHVNREYPAVPDNIIDRETVPVVADGKKGDDAAQLVLSPSMLMYKADRAGNAVSPYAYMIGYKLLVNGTEVTITSKGHGTLPTNVSETGAGPSSYQFTVASGTSPSGTFTIWATGTLNGVEYTAEAAVGVVANRQGDIGTTGRMFYLAGIWDSEDSSHVYNRTDELCPIVEWNDNYWYLDAGSARGHDDEPSGSSTKWKVIPNFTVVMTETLFAEFAKLGSFVVAGDFFISQFGVLKSSNQTKVVDGTNYYKYFAVDNNGNIMEYSSGANNFQPAYTYFDALDPNASTTPSSGEMKFAPTLVLNALTGKVYMNNAVIKGTLNGATGTFSGNLTADSTSFKELTCNNENYGRTTINATWIDVGGFDWFGIASQVKRSSDWYDTITVGTRYSSYGAYGRIVLTDCDRNGHEQYFLELKPSSVKMSEVTYDANNSVTYNDRINIDAENYKIELSSHTNSTTITLNGDTGGVSANRYSANAFVGKGNTAAALPYNIITNTTASLPESPQEGTIVFCTRCNIVRCGQSSGNTICDNEGTNRGYYYDFGNTKPRIFYYKEHVWYEFTCFS